MVAGLARRRSLLPLRLVVGDSFPLVFAHRLPVARIPVLEVTALAGPVDLVANIEKAFEVPGDTDLMFRIVIEEFARMGWGQAAILATARDPFYAALHGLLHLYGEQEFARRVGEILSRVGVVKVRLFERPPASDLMQIESSTT